MNLVLTMGREGVQSLENLADVICASPLMPINKTLNIFSTSGRARNKAGFFILIGKNLSTVQTGYKIGICSGVNLSYK